MGVNDLVAAATFSGCVGVIVSMAWWLWLLRRNINPLWYFFGSIIFAKISIAILSVSWLAYGIAVPVARIVLLVSVYVQLAVVVDLCVKRQKRRQRR